MITKLRWKQIQKGDYIWFGRGWREVVRTYPPHGDVFALKFNRVYLKEGCKYTVYYYWDIYKKIKAICKPKGF